MSDVVNIAAVRRRWRRAARRAVRVNIAQREHNGVIFLRLRYVALRLTLALLANSMRNGCARVAYGRSDATTYGAPADAPCAWFEVHSALSFFSPCGYCPPGLSAVWFASSRGVTPMALPPSWRIAYAGSPQWISPSLLPCLPLLRCACLALFLLLRWLSLSSSSGQARWRRRGSNMA